MCARPGQTDLMDGEDESRNAQVAALKRLFYSAEAEESVPDEESAAPSAVDDTAAAQHLGLLPELPCCRWPWEILPHHQKVLVVFEPEYTHMFEEVLASPAPHLYMHLMLPGGTKNLANEKYALRPGTSQPLHGTLMQVVAAIREPDSRLILVVQGIARAVVVRGTQALPFSRADVQLLPDIEALQAGARASD